MSQAFTCPPSPTGLPYPVLRVVAEPAVTFLQGMSLRDIEKSVILETLRQQSYNRTKAARVLGIGIRTLQRKIKQYREEEGRLDDLSLTSLREQGRKSPTGASSSGG